MRLRVEKNDGMEVCTAASLPVIQPLIASNGFMSLSLAC
jgi:hypothetical protein